MAVVVDASVLVVLASSDPRKPTAEAQIQRWLEAGEELHAPELLPYEVANGLTRLVAGGALPADRLDEAWETVMAVPLTYHALREGGRAAVDIALMLSRRSAYDAAYLALGRELAATLWAFDGSLARNAQARGYAVQLLR